jgi:hypothetical protein
MSRLASLRLFGLFWGVLAVGCAAGGGEGVPDGAGAVDLRVEPSLADLRQGQPGEGDLADDGSDLTVLAGDTVLRVHYPRSDARYSQGEHSWRWLRACRGRLVGAMTKVSDGLFQTPRIRGATAADRVEATPR